MISKKWIQAMILFFVGSILWAIVDPAPPHYTATVLLIGHYAGAGIALLVSSLLLVLIPATMYRFSEGAWPSGPCG